MRILLKLVWKSSTAAGSDASSPSGSVCSNVARSLRQAHSSFVGIVPDAIAGAASVIDAVVGTAGVAVGVVGADIVVQAA